MKSLYILVLVLVVLAGGWFVAKEKKSPKQSDSTAQVSETPAETNTAANSAVQPAIIISLTVTSPADGATVTTPTVMVKGKTVPKADVFVNDAEAKADASGYFSVSLTLDEGDNPIVVSANDADGNVAEKELTVNYDSGK